MKSKRYDMLSGNRRWYIPGTGMGAVRNFRLKKRKSPAEAYEELVE